MNLSNGGLRLPRYMLLAGKPVEVKRTNEPNWRPHVTTKATSFRRYESTDLARLVFREGDWLVRAWPSDVVDYRPERKLGRWKLNSSPRG